MFEETDAPEEVDAPIDFPQVLVHRWKSRGQEVYCVQCPHPHGFTLRVGQHLVGEQDGQPVIERVFDVPDEA